MMTQSETMKTQSYASRYFPALSSTCKILCELMLLNIQYKELQTKISFEGEQQIQSQHHPYFLTSASQWYLYHVGMESKRLGKGQAKSGVELYPKSDQNLPAVREAIF